MYKVMIIDDEEIVRMGIRDLIDWEKEGFCICAEGRDGRDGLEKLLQYEPDVALVDIKMPGLSGIDLIRAAREKNYNGYFVILTGYSEFEFAKSAIQLGVKEYLLKPIDEDELTDIMRKLYRDICKKEGELAWHSSNEEIAREELLRRILLRLESREKMEEQMKRYQMDYSGPVFCAAVISDKDLMPGNENRIFTEKVEELLGSRDLCADRVLMDNCVVAIQKDMDYRTWANLLAQKNARIGKRFGHELVIAVGHNVSNWYDLTHSYEFAKYLLEHEFLFGGCSVMSMDTIENQGHIAENPSVDYFCMLIEVGDMDGIARCVKRFRQYCLKGMMKEMDIKIQVMYNLMQIRNWAEKKYEVQKLGPSDLMEKINGVEKLDDLMEGYCGALQELCIKVGCAGSDNVIKRMYYYMERNYDKDLRLEAFSKMFHYNSSYLGKIFRKEMGDSFNNILDTIRITNAKRLLAETDLKVYQISERVGYSNIDYFYLKFKKYVGISPREYKKQVEAPDTETV
ncbi:MAG: response regulator [Marvinbryantia sp.]|uniref:response regulator n=1 Tax=Marvinbryantia sp. TaxID=2496532 RepID=UPI0025D38625|nr:response regulator [uncultured Marvinbryantia sp.]